MVFYLGLNYLEQAVAAKHNLLEKCLIAVPQHFDYVDAYLHKGNLPDAKYRFPWKRAKTDDQFLIQESTSIFTDVCGLATEDVTKKESVESFHSQQRTLNTSLTEAVNFELICDVIPSSNPSTQDPFSPDDFFMERNLFQEAFEKENLTCFSSTCDPLKIESTENAKMQGLADTLLSVPDLSRLASRLKAVHVKDPLLQENGVLISQDSLFRNERMYCHEKETPMLQKAFDSTMVRETVQKMTKPTSSKQRLYLSSLMCSAGSHKRQSLECDPALRSQRERYDPIDILTKKLEHLATLESSFLGKDAISLMKSEILRSLAIPKTIIIMDDEPDLKSVVAKDIVKTDQIQLPCIEQLDLPPVDTVKSSFLDINAVVVTEQDQFCERAVLDTPVVESTSSNKNYSQQKLPVVAKEPLELSQAQKDLLNDEKKKILYKRIWHTHKYCDEIQTSRLPEPEFSKDSKTIEPAVKQALKKMKVQADTYTGSTDLELNWNIVKFTEEVIDPCKLVAPFSTDMSDYEEQKIEVEKIEKYSKADLYVWKDEEISLDDCKGNSIDMKENRYKEKCLIQKKKFKFFIGLDKAARENNKNQSDPLGDFMTLRSKYTTSQSWNAEDNIECDSAIKKKELADECNKKLVYGDRTELKQNLESKKKVKHHVVEIQMTEKYQHILDILEAASEKCMHVLKKREEMSSYSTFKAITPDVSRFLLKQREKYLLDHKEDGLSDEVYKMIVYLHGLVVASEITENCCLESAILCLGAFQEKYKDVLGGCLNVVRQKLFELKTQLNEERAQHPRVMTLCKEIDTWFKKKRTKTGDSEQKILILVKREMTSLLNCLKNALAQGNLLSPHILSSSDPGTIIESLDIHNCVIACTKTISENFPWAQFSLVVEYENENSSPWQQLCERQNIRHIGLSMLSKENLVFFENSSEWLTEYPDQQICLIGSEKVTNNTELLQLLETRHNILLIERDYSFFGNTKHLFFPDIDVDVNSAIVIEDLKTMIDDCVVQNTVTKMVALSLKYTSCWFILLSHRKCGSYHFPGHIISNLSRLQAAVSNFAQRSNNFQAKVIICEGCSELSSLIRNISEQCIRLCKSSTTSTWLDRFWLKNEISQEEKFLLMLPCLSSMSAQLLLKKVSLMGLFILSLEDLSQAVPEISVRILKTLKRLICSSTGLHLRDFPEMKSSNCYDEEVSVSENQASRQRDTELNCQTEPRECLLEETLKENYKDMNDIYVSEDFQKCIENLDTKFETGFDSKNVKMFCNGSRSSEKVEDNRELNDFVSRDETCTHFAETNAENREGNGKNVIYSTSICTEKSGEELMTKKIPFEETFHGKNKNRGWESLDQFISSNADFDKVETRFSYVKEKKGAMKLDPVEKLHTMRQCDQLRRTASDRDVEFKQKTIGQLSDEQIRKKCKEGQNELGSSLNKLQGLSKEPAFDQLYKQCFASNGEAYEKNRKLDISQNIYSSGNFRNVFPHHGQGITGQQNTTFEYNHGLPFPTTESYKQPIYIDSRKEMFSSGNTLCHNGNVSQFEKTSSNRCLGYETGCKSPKMTIDLEKEFPPAEEIDRSVSFESKVNNHISRDNYVENDVGLARFIKENHSEQFIRNISSYFADAENQEMKGQLCLSKDALEGNPALTPFEDTIRSDKRTNVQTSNLILTNDNFENKRFNFNPQLDDIVFCEKGNEPQSVQQTHTKRQDLYLNPRLERISHKIYQVEGRVNRNATIHTHSLEDDLRETTKKLLANSRQFSRFDMHTKRHPLQKVSIGLAQPRLRNSSRVSKEDLHVSEQGRQMMAQSPWATEDSPPMDLDNHNTEINRILQNDTSNRVCYTNQTPHKKRKLTYQAVPGKKGQTQLVFN